MLKGLQNHKAGPGPGHKNQISWLLFGELVRACRIHSGLPRYNSIILAWLVCRCYCILHEDNVLGAIFSLWKELKAVTSWEEVENFVWGELNRYQESCTR